MHEEAVKALEDDVHDKHGWLSDAQYAQLHVESGLVFFCGEGSIDLNHMVSIVMGAVK